MKICVLGLGYIGLPTAVLFATHGHEVVGVDINKKVVEKLNKGEAPFFESGLNELLNKTNGNFIAKTNVEKADVFLISVPTPLEKSVMVADLKYVRLAAEMIYPNLNQGNLVVLESTVPPGTCEKLLIPILEKSGLNLGDFNVSHCPERAIPRQTLHEMVNNDRIIGGCGKKSAELTKSIYTSFVKGKIYLTDTRTAEFVKLMENTSRDVSIALANEFAQISEECGINIWEAIELANKHPRVDILKPGPGVGGHCIAVDPWFLKENSSKFKIISLARDINDSMPNYILQLIKPLLKDIRNPTITIFGVAYKGNVDDTRETPATKLVKLAENEGYNIKCHDPLVKDFEYEIYNLDESIKDSDCIVLVVDHDVFRNIVPSKLKVRNKNFVDARNFLNSEEWKQAGFNVITLGNGKYRNNSLLPLFNEA